MAIVDSLLVRPFRAEPFLSGQRRPVRLPFGGVRSILSLCGGGE
jgi:hypothetical protein